MRSLARMNKRGVAMITAYMVVAFLGIMGAAFMSGGISESRNARRYFDNERAFWIAEAGMAQAYHTWAAGGNPSGAVNFGGGNYVVDTGALPIVTVTGNFDVMSSQVTATFSRIPNGFSNTISVGGNMTLTGLLARIEVYDRTRISGSFHKSGLGSQSWFADKVEGVGLDQTTIPIPDLDHNGTPNEFNDFVAYGRDAVANYPASETVYIQNNGTVNIFPNHELVGKKIIFVEGSGPGTGNVNIFFDATWQNGEDVTIISTGTISYVEPLQYPASARLSAVSWSDYNEVSVFRSQHESVVLAHGNSNFVDILDWGSMTGNVITNGNMSLTEVLTYEKYFYSNRSANGDMPPGFSLLGGSTGTPLFADWRELN